MGAYVSCPAGQFNNFLVDPSHYCAPCPTGAPCLGGDSSVQPTCPSAQVVFNNACVTTTSATCPTGSTCTCKGNYQLSGSLCYACPAGQLITSGVCAPCGAGTVYSGNSKSCISCGALSLTNAAGAACVCDSAAGAILQSDGTCGCAVGYVAFGGQCKAATPAACNTVCPSGFSSDSDESDGYFLCYRGSLYCSYTNNQLDEPTPGCPSQLSKSCSCPANAQLNDGNCISCPSGQVVDQNGECAMCPAGTTYSTSQSSCISCGATSLANPAGSSCQCDASKGSVLQTDGSCGCATGMAVSPSGTCMSFTSCRIQCPPAQCGRYCNVILDPYTINCGPGCRYLQSDGSLDLTRSVDDGTCPVSICQCPSGSGRSSDGSCFACQGNTYQTSDGQCTACPTGTIANAAKTSCLPCPQTQSNGQCICPAGIGNRADGSCNCPPNTTLAVDGSCQACPTGSISDGVSANCTPCGDSGTANPDGTCSCTAAGQIKASNGACTCPSGMSLVYGQCQSGVSCPPTCPPSTPIYGGLNYGSTECRNSVGGVCAYGTNYEYAYSGAVDNIGVDCPSSITPCECTSPSMSRISNTCYNCPTGQVTDGNGGCMLSATGSARNKQKRSQFQSGKGDPIRARYKSTSKQIKSKRDAAVSRQQRASWR